MNKSTNGKRILIISHSNFLKVLTAKKVDKKGKARSEFLFYHMDLIYATERNLIDSKCL
jgi:hypothetical protein